ncbi:hypothetical protein AAVH_24604 [Aphelenchoides avenae]|nr:hypothetical protein AAVH_24604 [Aphelenchus avenae]
MSVSDDERLLDYEEDQLARAGQETPADNVTSAASQLAKVSIKPKAVVAEAAMDDATTPVTMSDVKPYKYA